MRSEARKTEILGATEALLAEVGGAGLTMRKVADRSGISLGNLQYHFATRDALLQALLHRFLSQYEETLKQSRFVSTGDLGEDLRTLFLSVLRNPDFDACASVFKEIWAASSQNSNLQNILASYYRRLSQFYRQMLISVAGTEIDPKQIDRAVSVILPMLEGHCVTKSALSISDEQLASEWSAVYLAVLSANARA